MNGGEIGLGTILLLSLLPVAGNLIGVALAEWKKPPDWLTGGALHAAAGIGTAVATVELIPRGQERIEIWMLAAAILAGGIVAIGLARLTRYAKAKLANKPVRATTWGAFAAVGIDLLSDGLMTGSGGAVSANLGLLLALSQVLGNLPGGFAVAAGFRSANVDRGERLRAMALYPFLPVIGALIGFLLLKDAGDMLIGVTLAVFGGLLLTATVEDIVPEADERGAPRRISSPSFAAGFALLLLMSAYLGG
ncbi:ZIP family metal transporter [Aurantiacibacter zhengii]|mgnify:FL=1|jgi:zinc transporter, ZIP family|uniref:ZIP family zinc transporter n=1 Tax=Aurantiacibacter zhengii TaxID=2307003 RepID=A0A418NPQ5_9SPHN|nr:hypothetical protein [Aurantiacibacter zhengii]RIV84254.1 hypothetical protein D2V07_14695 [Aurantiacibacter zhengii]|tara:strand:- start:14391 stop:15140 length:750 start_codon:yes stop_codon:yes gene_type:complete